MSVDIYQAWFKLADEDKDGAVAGVEAVKFFQRSGLGQDVLGQIWELASNGGPKLSNPQFTTAMRLVSLAQVSGGRFLIEQARAVVAGFGPALPVPRMAGLETPATAAAVPAPASAPYTPQVTGVSPAVPAYMPQVTGGTVAAPPSVVQAPAPDSVSSSTGATAAFPPAAPQDMQRYHAAFAKLDTDNDGYVQGGDCFGFFMSSGLEKTVLRDIWAVVAGNAGALSRDQFAACLYLMDRAKRGFRPPASLPPGPFPPQGPAQAPQPLPTLPAKLDFSEPPPPVAHTSRVPRPDPSLLATGTADERLRLQAEVGAAEAKEQKHFVVEDAAAAQRGRQEAYNKALQELTMFKSRMDVAMLTSEETITRLTAETDMLAKRYESMLSAAAAHGEAGKRAQEQVQRLSDAKAEAEARVMALEMEIAQLAAVAPQELARMEAEVRLGEAEVANKEQMRNAMVAQLDAARQRMEGVKARGKEAADAHAALESELEGLTGETEEMRAAAEALRVGAPTQVLQSLLVHAAGVYRSLYVHATKVALQVPPDARLESPELIAWGHEALEGTGDWPAGESAGFVSVSALPDIEPSKPVPLPVVQEMGPDPSLAFNSQPPAQYMQAPAYGVQYAQQVDPSSSSNSGGFAFDFSNATASSASSGFPVVQQGLFTSSPYPMGQPEPMGFIQQPAPAGAYPQQSFGFPTAF